MREQATIFALSTAPGRAALAVFRISGPAAGDVIDRMAGPRPPARTAGLKIIRDPETREALDQGLVLWFPAPRSETGEDLAELHVHGGRAVAQAMLRAIGAVPGTRMAEPGEFARRAFENGKIDLTQAEAIADLVDAETEAQARQALRQAGGALAKLYEGWRAELIEALALMEAAIDFSDEGDVGDKTAREARVRAEALAEKIRRHLDDGRRGEILRDGFHVVIAGPPNVGKSSFLNAMVQREAAIVSEEAGTTRDVIEVRMDLGGLPVVLSDTAGIRETEGKIEREGIRRTIARARDADLVLWLMDATAPEQNLPPDLAAHGRHVIRVLNKIDLVGGSAHGEPGWLRLSMRTGEGLAEVTKAIEAEARERIGATEAPVITQARHRQQLEACARALGEYLGGALDETELRAEDLRRATMALGRITGRVDVEDVLDQIFGRFCIGK
ncbi:MAG: tRNA uridine-5-carboxymethylaminomethyl(34) synthesis GTPase MnmE [Hyphomicrobiaceae bacterium]